MDEEGRRRIAALASALRPRIARMESSGPTTADYVWEIERLAHVLGEPLPGMHLAIGMALIRAGANLAMVNEALRSEGHLPRREPYAWGGPEDEQGAREVSARSATVGKTPALALVGFHLTRLRRHLARARRPCCTVRTACLRLRTCRREDCPPGLRTPRTPSGHRHSAGICPSHNHIIRKRLKPDLVSRPTRMLKRSSEVAVVGKDAGAPQPHPARRPV